MRVRVLGPVDVAVDGASCPVSGQRRRAVLAVFALHEGETVSIDRLVDAVWGGVAPSTAVNTLQSHVSHLRGILGGKAALITRPPGYLLDLGGEGTDVQAAERLLRRSTRAAGPAEGGQHLRAALALWRGRPLADVASSPWLEQQAERLDRLHEQVQRAMADVRLVTGQHAELVPELELMAVHSPLDEQLHRQLMLALYRCGRQAEALAVFHRLRAALDEQLGVEPSLMLRDLHTAILRQDPELTVCAPVVAVPPVRQMPVPAQLPSAVRGFAGRAAELASLDAALAEAGAERQEGPAAVVISAVSGTAGVGKTALAVHWAHKVAGQFPDGQLYLNLRGFDPGGQAAEPGEAVLAFLEALGAAAVPDGLPAQTALYRSLLAGKRMLIVLDNARDADQVRPLLPGSPGCLVIVTSRSQLTGLVAADGAFPVNLDLFTAEEAGEFLARRLGEARVEREPVAAAEIIRHCARLPLALTVAAARAAARPGFPLAVIAAELREAAGTLDPFGGNDLATDVRAVFSWSYQALSDGAARLFRLLGLHPGADISVPAAASLAALPPARARALLDELTGAHLLTEHHTRRYAMHDLLRTYAAEQTHALEGDRDRAATVLRVLEHYLHTGHRAVSLVEPYYAAIMPVGPQPGVIAGELATIEDALSWFASERAGLLAAVQLAADAGLASHAWQLAWLVSVELLRHGLWEEQLAASTAALNAARVASDTAAEAHALIVRALGYERSGRFGPAEPLFTQALRLLETDGGYPSSQAIAHSGLAWAAERRGRPGDVLSHSLRAYALHGVAGNRTVQAMILNDIGYSQALMGNYHQALIYCERALGAFQNTGEHSQEANTWDSLGFIHHKLGNHQRAIACYERAVSLSRDLADLFNEGNSLSSLGDVHHSAGHAGAARRVWAQALRILERIDHPDAEDVRAKLRFGNGRPPGSPAWDVKPLDRAESSA